MATILAEAVTEKELVVLAQQGDRNAYGELVRRHYQGVVRVVYRMCGDTALAEDATQEAFIRAWVSLPSFQPAAPLRSWLYRIAINAALDVLRRKPEESLEENQVTMVTDQAASPEMALIEKERVTLVQQAMKALPEAARSVLVLREYGELSYQEIAKVLDIPIGTVMSRLNYARNRLRELLKGVLFQLESEHD
ncbi:MAG TPA: sigma-70 family RNA polymerase sigma factor [Anaerolineales bacterium]|nr:sigma-70 family RNA polymerase sigma factor [Anaerolineales bacterium]